MRESGPGVRRNGLSEQTVHPQYSRRHSQHALRPLCLFSTLL
jgi:hypothetical protein